ncbi:hypothetical protein V8C44DRAFT_115784 [Trichoderma aethiopicum]
MGRGRLFSALRLRIWGRMEAAGMLLGTVPAERDRGLLLYLKSRADRVRDGRICVNATHRTPHPNAARNRSVSVVLLLPRRGASPSPGGQIRIMTSPRGATVASECLLFLCLFSIFSRSKS